MKDVQRHIALAFKRLILPILKYYPIIMNVFLLIIFFESFAGDYTLSSYCDPFLGYSLIVAVLLLSLSFERKFCAWHRLLILNMIFNMGLVAVDFYGYAVGYFYFILSVFTAMILVLSIIMLYKYGWFAKNNM